MDKRSRRKDQFVSASELARLGYCERQVVFDAMYGRKTTAEQRQAQARGVRAHAAFYDESQRIAAASAKKGKCFIATMVLGDCQETRHLRAFRDLYLRRSVLGRWVIGAYYAHSPRICDWLVGKTTAIRVVRLMLKPIASAAGVAVQRKVG